MYGLIFRLLKLHMLKVRFITKNGAIIETWVDSGAENFKERYQYKHETVEHVYGLLTETQTMTIYKSGHICYKEIIGVEFI